ncbi:uncharacterized protein ACA1_227110 [Acanthamoeba castellanii str. Neff]|uniref:Uncharacterized protein n=1 Tax=Acanthamoeba castellanii (strain ATCC 30010 / Neff) TaxID=1257118 RepID=L8HAY7_ACACF|nr:uncharacterized protein ACA1_227110 [Acanthamoeba castellanii str. Neff]ELR21561.1 hypothetical protein ACA1_227110 [Acanthamoeba castellanii str. Neff]
MATIIILRWEGKQWFSDLMDLCIKAPVSIPNRQSSFKWFGSIPLELLCNPMWHWIACRISDLALAPATWQRYHSSLIHFHNFCEQEEVDFPPEQEDTMVTITNFIESMTHALQHPSTTINMLLAVISTFKTFDLSNLTTLFHQWGTNTPPARTRAKLIALLCILGVLRVLVATPRTCGHLK